MTGQRLTKVIRDVARRSRITITKNDPGRSMSTAVQPQPKSWEEKPQKTALYDLHVKYGGKIVDFSGYYLPMQYEDASITLSHQHTRSNCSIFDVSHMLQTTIYGKHAVELLESVCVTDIASMKNNQSALSLFTIDANGGIIDDLIITKVSENVLYLVSNALRRRADKELLLDRLDSFRANNKDVKIEFMNIRDQSLIAVQGPKSAQILQPFVNVNLERVYFMNSAETSICGIDNCRVTRCGYTGEDGFELSVPSEHANEITETLLNNEFVKLAGLGARDTLRLESGLCLYGNDIDETTTPVQAALSWTISKRRKQEQNFPGSACIMRQLKNGVDKKRIGLVKTGGPPARSGTQIVNTEDRVIGHVTSGCPAPSLGSNIAMGYVNVAYSKPGTDVYLKIREKLYDATISKMPFGPVHYYLGPAKKSS